MYFQSKIEIDPSQSTEIRRTVPTKVFGRMLYWMTAGLSAEREEQETFSALCILQRINQALRSVGADRILRLSKDGLAVFVEQEEAGANFVQAMETFQKSEGSAASGVFERLGMVVGHRDEKLAYSIEIDVIRCHAVGEYPIQVLVRAVIPALASSAGERSREATTIFDSQDSYEEFEAAHRQHFDEFVQSVTENLRHFIGVDDARCDSSTRLLRASKRDQDGHYDEDHDDFLSEWDYIWWWGEYCHAQHIYVHDVTLVDTLGHAIVDIGATGFDAGANAMLDPTQDFVGVTGDDLVYHGDNQYEKELVSAGVCELEADTESPKTESLLGDWTSFGESSSESSDASCSSGDSGSSCSSCSSCSSD